MKNFKKIVMWLLFFVLVIVPFSACKSEQNSSAKCEILEAETIYDNLQTIENYALANILNELPANHTYNESQIKALKPGFSGFVLVGTVVDGTVDNLSFAGKKFVANKTAKVLVGNNVFFEDKVFFVNQSGQIFVNALVLKIEIENNSNLCIGSKTITFKSQQKTKSATYSLASSSVTNVINQTSASSYDVELFGTDPAVLSIDKLSENGTLYIVKNINNQTIEYELNHASYSESLFTYIANIDLGASIQNNEAAVVSYTIATTKYLPICFDATIIKNMS